MVPQLVRHGGDIKTVGEQNIAFTYDFLERERICIVSEDIGGDYGRVIYFDSSDFSVYRSLIDHQQIAQVEKEDIRYYETSKQQLKKPQPPIKMWK